jgi:hypothetical protein
MFNYYLIKLSTNDQYNDTPKQAVIRVDKDAINDIFKLVDLASNNKIVTSIEAKNESNFILLDSNCEVGADNFAQNWRDDLLKIYGDGDVTFVIRDSNNGANEIFGDLKLLSNLPDEEVETYSKYFLD